jgi:hypothetical protein
MGSGFIAQIKDSTAVAELDQLILACSLEIFGAKDFSESFWGSLLAMPETICGITSTKALTPREESR